MCYPKLRLTFAQDINPFWFTVQRLRTQHWQWLLLCSADWLCSLGGFSSLAGHCVPSFQAPMKRIISGNDHWHCLPWLMATSQYLMSHRLHPSYSQRLIFGPHSVTFVCCWFYAWHVKMRYESALVKRTAIWNDDRPVKWADCNVEWTGCWVMSFIRHGQTCQLLLVLPVPSLSFPAFIFHPPLFLFHTTLVTHCVARQGHVGTQLIRAKESLILRVCPWKRVIPKKQWQAFNYHQSQRASSTFLVARCKTFSIFFWNCSENEVICRKHIKAFTGPRGPLGDQPAACTEGTAWTRENEIQVAFHEDFLM